MPLNMGKLSGCRRRLFSIVFTLLTALLLLLMYATFVRIIIFPEIIKSRDLINHCPGEHVMYIPSNERTAVASCEWDDHERPLMVLYGTIKGTGDKKFKANDPFNPFIIMDRTLRNWASLSGVQTVIFTEDAGVINYINKLNKEIKRDVAEHGLNATYHNVIHYIQQFEHGTKVKRAPTYRGMFRAIIEAYPGADLLIYANADILFTRSLTKTARFVQRYYDCVVKPNNPLVHGFFVTGSRINVDVPTRWNPWTRPNRASTASMPLEWLALSAWEQSLLTLMKGKGKKYTPAAMDYFIYSASLMDWNYDFAEADFLLGGVEFDTMWFSSMMRLAEVGEVFAVESTRTLVALHQNNNKDVRVSVQTPQSAYNKDLRYYSGSTLFYYLYGMPSVTPFYLAANVSASVERYDVEPDYWTPNHPMYIIGRKTCYRYEL